MPIVIALFIRSMIQLTTTLVLFKTAESFLKAALDALPQLLSKVFDISEEESRDFIHDFMIDQALAFGLTVIALRKQMPTVVAERLGFTSKGFSKLGFNSTVKKKLEEKIGSAVPANLAKGISYWGVLGKFMGVITAVFMGTQSIEVFAYRPQFFTNILGFFGLGSIAQKVLIPPKTPLFSDAEIKQYATSLKITEDEMRGYLEAADAVVKAQVKVPTQANLLEVIRTSLLPTHTPATAAATAQSSTSAPSIKVFTGIISQGNLVPATAFTPRPDDLITSIEDLRIAAENNLAPYLASLAGKVIYQLQSVASVTTKDGFTQRGTTQRVVSGYSATGAPKYKTVTNKFAVLDIFILNDKGSKTRLTRVVLGPTDAINFKPTQDELGGLETKIKADLATGKITGITSVTGSNVAPTSQVNQITAAPTSVVATAPVTPPKPVDVTGVFVDRERHYDQLFKINGQTLLVYLPYTDLFSDAERSALSQDSTKFSRIPAKLAEKGVDVNKIATVQYIADITPRYQNNQRTVGFAEFFGTTPTVATPEAEQVATPGANATNLSEFFIATGQSLPPIEARAVLYEQYALGPSSYYTGTAEQNAKLLSKLQGK